MGWCSLCNLRGFTPSSVGSLHSRSGCGAPLMMRCLVGHRYVYHLPFYRLQRGFAGHLLGGWEISGIVYAQTGLWLSVHGVTIDPAGLGVANFSTGPSFDAGRINLRIRTVTRPILFRIGLMFPHSLIRPQTAFGLEMRPAAQYLVPEPGAGTYPCSRTRKSVSR
jgi:hypothetical protein